MTSLQKFIENYNDETYIVSNELSKLLNTIEIHYQITIDKELILDKFIDKYPNLMIEKSIVVDFIDDLLNIDLRKLLVKNQELKQLDEEKLNQESNNSIDQLQIDLNNQINKFNHKNHKVNYQYIKLINIILIILIIISLIISQKNLRLELSKLLDIIFFNNTTQEFYWWQDYEHLEKLIWYLKDHI